MNRKLTSVIILLTVIASFAINITTALAAAVEIPGYKLLASENFGDYKMPNGKSEVKFRDYPADGESNVNGGFGWAGPWSPSDKDFSAKFGDMTNFSNHDNGTAFAYSQNYHRKLASPLAADVDNELYIKFSLTAQTISSNNSTGVSLFNDKVRLTFSEYDNDGAGLEKRWHPNCPAIVINGVPYRNESKLFPHRENDVDNTAYTFIAHITLNSDGKEIFKLKIFQRGGVEPEEWDVTAEAELGSERLDYISFMCWSYATYWKDFAIYQKNIAHKADVLTSAGGKEALTSGMLGAAVNVESFAVDLGAKYTINQISVYFAAAGASDFSIYGANNDDMSGSVLLAEESGAVGGTIWKAAIDNAPPYKYIYFTGAGSYSITQITVNGDFFENAFEPVFCGRGAVRIFDGDFVSTSEECLYFNFNESVNVNTLNGAIKVERGNGSLMPIIISYDDSSFVVSVNLSEAFKNGEKYAVSMANTVRSESGKAINKAFRREFYGNDYVTYSFRRGATAFGRSSYYTDIINASNTALDAVAVSVVSRGGNTTQAFSSAVTKIAAHTNGYSISNQPTASAADDITGYAIRNWESLAPLAEVAPVKDSVTIDSITTDDYQITIKGEVFGENEKPFGGREVTAALVKKDKPLPTASGANTDVINLGKITAGDDGKYTLTVKMNSDIPSGVYDAYVGTNYGEKAVKQKYFFMNNARTLSIVEEYNGTADVAAMEALIKSTAVELDIDIIAKSAGISDFSKVAQRMRAKKYTTPEQIMSVLNDVLMSESINQALTPAAMGAEITARANDVDISLKKYNALIKNEAGLNSSTPYVTALWNALYAKIPFADSQALSIELDKQLDIQLQARHPIPNVNTSFQSRSFNIGQIIDMTVRAEAQTPVSAADIKFIYDSTLLTFTGLTKDAVFNSAAVNTADAGIITIKLPEKRYKNGYVFPSGELFKLSFIQKNPSPMNSKLDMSAVIDGYDTLLEVDRAFYTDISAGITVVVSDGVGGQGGRGTSPSGGGGGIPVSVAPQPSAQPPKSLFSDLVGAEWAESAINYLAEKEVISGVGANIFEPNRNVKRDEFVKMLVGAFKLSAGDTSAQFTDVAATDWSYPYIAAAVENNIAFGYDDGRFGAGDNISREQMSAMLYRTITRFAPSVSLTSTLSFNDNEEISGWAADAVGALVTAGVINGMGENMFAPREYATRAQAAQVIYKTLKLFDKNI